MAAFLVRAVIQKRDCRVLQLPYCGYLVDGVLRLGLCFLHICADMNLMSIRKFIAKSTDDLTLHYRWKVLLSRLHVLHLHVLVHPCIHARAHLHGCTSTNDSLTDDSLWRLLANRRVGG